MLVLASGLLYSTSPPSGASNGYVKYETSDYNNAASPYLMGMLSNSADFANISIKNFIFFPPVASSSRFFENNSIV
jgi:hypothetical protein